MNVMIELMAFLCLPCFEKFADFCTQQNIIMIGAHSLTLYYYICTFTLNFITN